MRVFNQTRNLPLITQGRWANTFWLRLRGLLGAAPLQQEQGLILVGEKSIHTLFMSFPIDVVYVDKTYKVIRADVNMVPYRLGPFVKQSAYVLEMPVGVIADTATQTGDQLEFAA
ncbi:MAG: DUF192 domain-containing protein [Dehalococcoidia bacterium]|nr:MAG: DUF192 domain-containing protein [Dehalococcoidia bacterium]